MEIDDAAASAMPRAFARGDKDSVSEAERAAFGRAWQASKELQDTLQRAYEALRARNVADLNEYRTTHASAEVRSA
jgi:hypothetical protein